MYYHDTSYTYYHLLHITSMDSLYTHGSMYNLFLLFDKVVKGKYKSRFVAYVDGSCMTSSTILVN